MKVPSSSRRKFLKTTIAGATAALGDLNGLVLAKTAPIPTGQPAEAANDGPQGQPAPGGKASENTLGIGVYPGDPAENFAPTLEPDDSNPRRNLAFLRPAYHSSSYDYNLTAQLVTDGIKDTHLPRWVETSSSLTGTLQKEIRDFFLDHNRASTVNLQGRNEWVQVRLGGGESAPEIDRIDLLVVLSAHGVEPADVSFEVSVSDDGWNWQKAGSVTAPKPASLEGYPPGFVRHGGYLFKPSIPLGQASRNRYYRIECLAAESPSSARGVQWGVGIVAFYNGSQRVEVGGPYNFTSAWMSAGLGEEWVYVDLGASFEFDRVVLSWIAKAAEGSLQVSDDAEHWRDIQPLPGGTSPTDDLKLAQPARARYVRVLMTRPTSGDGYILSEMEVYGRGGFVARPKPSPPTASDGRIDLAGGSWRLQRDSLVNSASEAISKTGFDDRAWIVATVPGTVLTSYLNIGAIQDPNYGRNQLYISDSFFYADFWYRTEFTAPKLEHDEHAWLNFDGINWKADIYLNGGKIGRIDGGFIRGRFDVSKQMLPGRKNALAIRIIKNETPGSVKQKTFASAGHNGGALGLDNPTFHSAVGWDWISTIRGRDTGIWNDVYLTTSGPVTIENPFVTTTLPLPDTSTADVAIEVELLNNYSKPLKGKLVGRIGDVKFEQQVRLEGSAASKVKLDPSTHPALRLRNPKLWWPAGYGEPNLYDLELTFHTHRRVSDAKSLKVGVRQMRYSLEGGALRIWVNGRRLIPKGGNWGFSESMLRYRRREYDVAVRYHSDMHFNMIRNWVGQTGRDAFYEACDRHGVMVWQDFWLANPWDGPNPGNDAMFLRNARDFILRLRNHPSMGLYCGRNEGDPPPRLEKGLTRLLAELHPDIQYIPNSAAGPVSGHGPYRTMPLDYYFGPGANKRLHSERGMPNIPPMESVRRMMPRQTQWPQGLDWGLHDFCLQGAASGASYRKIIENGYGGATSAQEWVALAQFVNYEGYRAMYEGQSKHRMGLLIWMSHSCWPSFVWQTYDYYFEPTSAYFGAKKGCEPLHIQWNPVTESVEVVNYSGGNVKGLSAHVEILNMDGSRQWTKRALLDSREDSTVSCIRMEYPQGLTPVHFLRLGLTHQGNVISRNFYLRPLAVGDYRAIRALPKVNLEATTGIQRQGDRWALATNVRNRSSHPALMVRVKAVRDKTGDEILPAIYSNNYLALMPGEEEGIRTELSVADTRGEKPRIVVEGFNLGNVTLA